LVGHFASEFIKKATSPDQKAIVSHINAMKKRELEHPIDPRFKWTDMPVERPEPLIPSAEEKLKQKGK
jgi:hypothetical protein